MQRPTVAGTGPVLPQHNAPTAQAARPSTVTAAARNICQSTIQCLKNSGQFVNNNAVKLAFGVNTATLFFATIGDLHDVESFKRIGGVLAVLSVPMGILALRADRNSENNQDVRLRQVNNRADNVEQRLNQLEQRVSQHLTPQLQAQQTQTSTNSTCVIS